MNPDSRESTPVRENDGLFRALLESAPDAMVLSAEGRILMVNAQAERLFGWTREELLGRPIEMLMPERSRGAHVEHRKRFSEKPAAREMGSGIELLARRKDGAEFPVEISLAPVQEAGRLLVMAAIRDVTTRRLAQERERDRTRDRLEAVGALAGGIAHDFNNLLTGIMGNLSLALELLPPNPETRAPLEQAERAAQRARALTNQLLAFAKGGAPVTRSLDLAPLLRDTATATLAATQVRITFEIAEDLAPVMADPDQLRLVVQSLARFAAQAMPDGGVVTLRGANVAGTDSPRVRVSVTDRGGGLPADALPRVFDPYFSAKAMGSGMGLATAYAIVTRHGGQMSAASEPGRGTTLSFELPAAAKPQAPERAEALGGQDRVKADILVMDDEEMIRFVAQAVLLRVGHRVHLAPDGKSAVDAYRQAREAGHPFDVVILDLTVPGGMGGWEAFKLLRELDPGVCAVVSSGYSDDPVMSRWRESGFAGAIPKPYTARDLDNALQGILRSRLAT